MGKLKSVGIVALLALALGAGWALWIGLKALATILAVGLVAGMAIGVLTSIGSRKRLTGSGGPSQLS